MASYYKHTKHKGAGKFRQIATLNSSDKAPIIIYQMGKVGSSSARDTLLDLNVGSVFHLHYFLPWRNLDVEALDVEEPIKSYLRVEVDHAKKSFKAYPLKTRLKAWVHEKYYLKPIYNFVKKSNKRVKFIVSVRDPISVNMSMFFQRFEQYAGNVFEKANLTTDQILDLFLNKYIFTWPITWFDKEMKPILGIDIYKYPFPKDKGYISISEGNYDILLYKMEISDAVKEKILAEFLGIKEFKLSASNVGESKVYGDQYNEFKKKIKLPAQIVNQLLDSKYFKHFFTDEEREKIYNRWIN